MIRLQSAMKKGTDDDDDDSLTAAADVDNKGVLALTALYFLFQFVLFSHFRLRGKQNMTLHH